MGFGDTIGGAALGIALGGVNNRMQLAQQKKLTEQQEESQMRLTEFNMKKQLEMWEKTGYGAQVDQMKRAGINPALMYGMGGGGGQSNSVTPGSVGAGQANAGAAGMGIQAGMQLALLKAQKENIEADTKNKLGDAANKPIVGENLQTQTQSLLQGINNQQAQEALTKMQTRFQELRNRFEGETLEDQISQVGYNLKKSIAELSILETQGKLDKAQYNDKIKLLHAEAIGAGLENILTEAQTELTREQTGKTKQEIDNLKMSLEKDRATIANMAVTAAQGWGHLSVDQQKVAIEAFKADLEAKYPGIMGVIGGNLDNLLRSVNKASGRTYQGAMPSLNTGGK